MGADPVGSILGGIDIDDLVDALLAGLFAMPAVQLFFELTANRGGCRRLHDRPRGMTVSENAVIRAQADRNATVPRFDELDLRLNSIEKAGRASELTVRISALDPSRSPLSATMKDSPGQ